MSRGDTKAQLQIRCDKLGEALEDARETIQELKRGNTSVTDTFLDGVSTIDIVADNVRYGDLRELVAQLRAALPAIDLERLRKALDEP